MKLCILMPAHWSGRLGGAEIQVRYLLNYLRQHTRHELLVLCRHASMHEDNGVPIVQISTMWPLARHSYLFDYPSVWRTLRRFNPDVVYTRVSSPLVGYAAQYCRRFKKSLVHHIARLEDVLPRRMLPGCSVRQSIERPIYEYGLRHANVVIAQANYQVNLLREYFQHVECAVIPNFHPSPESISIKDPQQRRIVWVANIKAAKRPEAFVALAERFRSLANVRFIMAGAMQDAGYSDLIAKAGRQSNFLYMGAASNEEVNRLLDSAHVFVNTSTPFGEGFPNTFIQAWLRGVPVASLEVNPDGLLDDLRLGRCSGGSFQQLATDVEWLLNDTKRLAAMATFARNYAMQTFGLSNLEKIRAILERVDLQSESSPRNTD